MKRRDFVKASALGTAMLAAKPAGAATPHVKSTIKRQPGPGAKLVRIGAIQTRSNPRVQDLVANPFKKEFTREQLDRSMDGWLAHYEEMIAQAAGEGCRLAVLPEDFTRIFDAAMFLDDRSIFLEAAARQSAAVPERLGAAAKKHGLHLVACYFAKEGDKIHNVADLIGPGGERIGRYRKVHMPQYEKWQVTPGDEFPAFETELGWIGMLICYDQMWPEAASCCAMNGAQLICHPSAAVLSDHYLCQRAQDNQVHYLSGTRNNAMISAPYGEILADGEDRDPAIVWADVDLNGATRSDEFFYEALYSGIQDHKERHLKFRRPETYGVLTQKSPPLARQYPEGGVAETPEEIDRVYQIVKKMRQGDRELSGKYHWKW